MNKFKIVLGDWSGKGHEKTLEYIVVVPDEFHGATLGANYRKNVELLGINPETFANGPEDSKLPADIATKLAAHNVTMNSAFYDEDGSVHIDADNMLEILMLLFGYGLDGFAWRLDEEVVTLVGSYDAIAAHNSEIGYGLFS